MAQAVTRGGDTAPGVGAAGWRRHAMPGQTATLPSMSFKTRMFLALAALLLAMLLGFAGLSRVALQRSLGQYTAEVEMGRLSWLAGRLEQRYALSGGWQFVQLPGAWQALTAEDRPKGPRPPPGPGPDMPWPEREPWQPLGPPPPWDVPAQPAGMQRQAAQAGQQDLTREPSPTGAPDAPLADPSPGPRASDAEPHRPPPPLGPPHARLYERLAVLDADQHWLAGAQINLEHAVLRTLRNVQGQAIGTLALMPAQGIQSEADRAFASRLLGFWLLIASLGLLLALGLAWWLGGRWLRPVVGLTDGARRMAAGQLDTRVPVHGRDELASLATAFNTMATELERLDSEQRQWLGEVAHELRTPLAALRAELEALQDGVRPWTPEVLARLHRQVLRLGALVDDLRLSLDPSQDTQAPEWVSPVATLRAVADDMRERLAQQGLQLDVRGLAAPALAQIQLWVPPLRLAQVMHNLLENSVRYTDAGGQVRLSAALQGPEKTQFLRLTVEDSAPGVPAEQLPQLFERFFRSDASRSRAHGGAGLGLAICRSLLQSMHGQIHASASALGGLRVDVLLPLSASSSSPSPS